MIHMFDKYTKIALAVNACKKGVDGRKKLQKMIYVAKTLGYPFTEGYTIYWYGPYSHELAAELKRMNELDLLSEESRDSSYVIKLTRSGKAFLEHFKHGITKEMGNDKLNKMEDLLKKLSQYEPWKLEILATLFYFYEIEHRDFETLKKVVRRVKPKFKDQEIDSMAKVAQSFLEKYTADQ